MQFLGDKIPLKGWTGHRGDLDLKDDSTGTFSVYRRWKGIEIMFHVSTLLPYTPGAEQQVKKTKLSPFFSFLTSKIFQKIQ